MLYRLTYSFHFKEEHQKGTNRNNKKEKKKEEEEEDNKPNEYMMTKISVPHGSKLHIPFTYYHLLAAQPERYKKPISYRKKFDSFPAKTQDNGLLVEKCQDRKRKRTCRKYERGIK